MAQIPISDVTAAVQIDLSDGSLAAKSGLSALTTGAPNVIAALPNLVNDPTPQFHDATFAAGFGSPSISLGRNTLGIKGSVNSALSVARQPDSPLFGPDDYDAVQINRGDCWAGFELDTLLDASLAAPLPDGFGVSFEASTAPRFATYVLIPAAQAAATTLRQAIERTLDAFTILDSSGDVLSIPQGVIYTNDLSGTVKIGGSWTLPLLVNQLSLAGASLPFNASVSVNPALTLSVGGDIGITGEFSVRFRRSAPNRIRLGLYKKGGTTLDASFTASAALAANVANTDLIKPFFNAVAPGVNVSGAVAGKIQKVVNSSVDRSLALALSAAWSDTPSEAAAMVYEIDVSTADRATRDAIDSALMGDWSGITKLTSARKIRNVITDAVEKKFTLTVNILGIFNYQSVDDFVAAMRVITDPEHGSIVITDSATATQIIAASTPLAADADRLRRALYNSFVATATYQALLAGMGATPSFRASQTYLLYEDSLRYRDALKQLDTGEALGVMPSGVKTDLPASGAPVRHARFAASLDYENNDVLRFFFRDVDALTPRTPDELKKIGRRVLVSLLDPQDPTDQLRIAALNSDAQWAVWDANPAQVPMTPAPYYSDWTDITQWADALAQVGPLLADAVTSSKAVVGDPAADPAFMKKRKALALALDGATKNTKAAFNQNFPICVMATLAGRTPGAAAPIFEAEWNGKTVFSNEPAPPAAAGRAAGGGP
ncbi:MAG: hypothetical protein ACRD3D_09340 [Terriglobia bacterium]